MFAICPDQLVLKGDFNVTMCGYDFRWTLFRVTNAENQLTLCKKNIGNL